jgi:hypothetical protein
MKVACFVNPLVQARGPCFNFGWVEALAKLLQPLHRDARCECMLIAGSWFEDWARQNQKDALLTGLRTVWLVRTRAIPKTKSSRRTPHRIGSDRLSSR